MLYVFNEGVEWMADKQKNERDFRTGPGTVVSFLSKFLEHQVENR